MRRANAQNSSPSSIKIASTIIKVKTNKAIPNADIRAKYKHLLKAFRTSNKADRFGC